MFEFSKYYFEFSTYFINSMFSCLRQPVPAHPVWHTDTTRWLL